MLAVAGAQPALACVLACALGGHAHGSMVSSAYATGSGHEGHGGMLDSHHASGPVPCHGASLGARTSAAVLAFSPAMAPPPLVQPWTLDVRAVATHQTPFELQEAVSTPTTPPPRSV